MKYIYSFLCMVLLFSCKETNSKKEEFEGVIKYAIRVETNDPEADRDAMQLSYGDTAVCYYKNGNFHSSYNGYALREAFYIGKENREYTVIAGIDSMIFTDCSKPLDDLKKLDGPVNDGKVGPFDCKRITIQANSFKRLYWYNEQFYLDPEHFKNYNTSHISRYYALAKAPYLKCRYEENDVAVTYTMVSIQKQPVADSVFNLPAMPRKEWAR